LLFNGFTTEAMGRSHLEFASTVWNLHYAGHSKVLRSFRWGNSTTHYCQTLTVFRNVTSSAIAYIKIYSRFRDDTIEGCTDTSDPIHFGTMCLVPCLKFLRWCRSVHCRSVHVSMDTSAPVPKCLGHFGIVD